MLNFVKARFQVNKIVMIDKIAINLKTSFEIK